MDLISKLKGSGGDSPGEQKPDRDPKDAPQQPPPTPDANKTKISLDRATREELVEFVKKQNVHTKKLETKYTELATQFRAQTASLKAAERQLVDLKTTVSDPQELTRLREAESKLARRVRDLEDTLQADAEFKRSLQSNIEELYKERKAAKAAADAQIIALQADLSKLQGGFSGSGDAASKASNPETEALLQERTAALTAARAEVNATYERARAAEAKLKEAVSEKEQLQQRLESETAALKAQIAEAAEFARKEAAAREQTLRDEIAALNERQSKAQSLAESESARLKEEIASVQRLLQQAIAARSREASLEADQTAHAQVELEARSRSIAAKEEALRVHSEALDRRDVQLKAKEEEQKHHEDALHARDEALEKKETAYATKTKTFEAKVQEVKRRAEDVVKREQLLAEQQTKQTSDASTVTHLQGRVQLLEEELRSSVGTQVSLSAQLAEAQDKTEEATLAKQKAESEALSLREEMQRIRDEHKRTANDAAKLQQEVASANKSGDEAKAAIERERQRLADELANAEAAHKSATKALQSELGAAKQEIAKLRDEVKSTVQGGQAAEQATKDALAKAEREKETAMAAAREESNQAHQKAARLEAELASQRTAFDAEVNALKERLHKEAAAPKESEDESAAAKAAREELEGKVAQLTTLLTKAKKAFQEKKAEMEALSKERDDAQAALKVAEQRAAEAEAKIQMVGSKSPSTDAMRLKQEKEALEQLVADLRTRVDDLSRSGAKSPIPNAREADLNAQLEEAKETENRALNKIKTLENKFQFLHTSNEEVEKALAQANKDRETLFQRCVELTAQLQASEDKLKRAEESERQVADLRHRLAEAEKERDSAKERERERELNASTGGAPTAVPAAAGGVGEGEAGAPKPEEQSGGAKDEGLEVKLLQEKVTYLKSLLARSNAQSKEQKRVVAELQSEQTALKRRIAELEAQQVAQRTVDAEAGQKAQASLLESNRLHEQLQTYKNKILSLDGELASVRGELSKTLDEFRAYKLRAQTVVAQSLKGAAPQRSTEAEDMALDLRQEVASLKKKMHELVTYNSELESYQKSAQAVAEDLARHEEQEAKLAAQLATLKAAGRRDEEAWREKFQSLVNERQDLITKHSETLIEVEMRNAEKFEELRVQLRTFREKSQAAVAEKEAEVTRLKQEIAALQAAKQQAALLQSIALREAKAQEAAAAAASASALSVHAENGGVERSPSATTQLPVQVVAPAAAGGGALHYAQMQAAREEELVTLKTALAQAQDTAREAEEMMRLHNLQEAALKKEIRELERTKKRDGANLEYLKNIVLKYMETQEHEKLLPVLTTILQFSPEEVTKVQEARAAQQGSGLWGYVGWGSKPAHK